MKTLTQKQVLGVIEVLETSYTSSKKETLTMLAAKTAVSTATVCRIRAVMVKIGILTITGPTKFQVITWKVKNLLNNKELLTEIYKRVLSTTVTVKPKEIVPVKKTSINPLPLINQLKEMGFKGTLTKTTKCNNVSTTITYDI